MIHLEISLCRYITRTANIIITAIESLVNDTAALMFFGESITGTLTGTFAAVGISATGTLGHVKVALYDAFCTPNRLNSNETTKPWLLNAT